MCEIILEKYTGIFLINKSGNLSLMKSVGGIEKKCDCNNMSASV